MQSALGAFFGHFDWFGSPCCWFMVVLSFELAVRYTVGGAAGCDRQKRAGEELVESLPLGREVRSGCGTLY